MLQGKNILIFLFTFSGFIVLTAILTLIYIPVLKLFGVTKNVLTRSTIVSSVASGAQVIPSFLLTLLIGSSTTTIVSIPSLLISTAITGHYLKKNLVIKTWKAYTTSFLVNLGASFLLTITLVVVLST